MRLQEKIKKDLAGAMKARDDVRRDAIRVLMGEMARQENKELTDDEVVRLIKRAITSEKETLEKQNKTDSDYIRVLDGYLPKMATEMEIETWIRENIDFAQFKNRMQAMKPIMQHFGATADGNTVKKLLERM